MNLYEDDRMFHDVWDTMVKQSTFAFYVLKKDAFYHILNTSKEEVQYKYASSLTALMDTKAYQQMLQTSKQHSEFIHELEVHEKTTTLYESRL